MSFVTPMLETARLILCPLQISDADQVQVLFPHWEIVRYLNNRVPWPYPSDGAYTFYRDVALPAVENGTAWEWTLRLKAEPERVIGAIGLRKTETDNRGFWLGLAWQRKGLMTEACDVVSAFWFDTLECDVLRVSKAVANIASRKISTKQGMKVVSVEERQYVCGRLPAEIWEITADEWNARRNQTPPR
jgi:ribosomal-protein-alanine N-acetyltransferase